MVTLANTKQRVDVDGNRVVEVDITFSTSYSTGGEAIDLDQVPLGRVLDAFVNALDPAASDGFQVAVDNTDTAAPTLKAYDTTGEVAAATDLSSVTRTVRLVGHG